MSIYQVETEDGHIYEVETEDPVSKPESFARGAVNNFPLAPQAVAALSEGPYSQNLTEWNQAAQTAKKANPITYGAGAVTGAMAPLAIPGVGPAMAARPIAANALLGGVSAISNTDLLQHPEEAAKEAVKGAGLGAATAGLIGKMLPKVSTMEGIANTNAVKTAGLRPSMLGGKTEGEISDIGSFINQHGLSMGELGERSQKAQALVKDFGKQIEDMGADALPGTRVNTEILHQKAQQYAGSVNRTAKGLSRDYLAGIQDLNSLGDTPTFAQLMEKKQIYGNLAFNPDHTVKNEAAKDVYFQLKDAITKTIQKSPEDYQKALTGYSLATDVAEGITKQHGIEAATGEGRVGIGGHGLHSLIKQIPGVSSPKTALPIGAGMAALGHPVVGATLAAHSMLATPQAKIGAAQTIGKAIPKVGNVLRTGSTQALVSHFINNPKAYGRFSAPLMQATQEGGSKGFAATSFVLRQQHPELNDIMLKAGEENEAGQ